MSSSDDDDDVPLSQLKARLKQSKPAPAVLSSSDEEDDGMMLAQMKRTAKYAVKVKKKVKTVTVKRGANRSKLAARKKAKTSKKSSSSRSSSRAGPSTDDDSYMQVFRTKGFKVSTVRKKHLVEGILIRWKFVLSFPSATAVLEQPPKGYIMLRGFPGVYVGIHGEHCGSLIDNRKDLSSCPSFENLIKRKAVALKEMLEEAIEKQIEELRAHDGPQRLLDDLALELKNVRKVNTGRLDKK